MDRGRGAPAVGDRVDQVARARRPRRRPRRRPSRVVASVSRSIAIVPRGLTSTPSSGWSHDRSGACPIARITESHVEHVLGPVDERRVEPTVRVEDRRRRRASRARRRGPSPDDPLRPEPVRAISIPSTSASSISNSCAGISLAVLERDRRATPPGARAASPSRATSKRGRRGGSAPRRRDREARSARRRARRCRRRPRPRRRRAPPGTRGSRSTGSRPRSARRRARRRGSGARGSRIAPIPRNTAANPSSRERREAEVATERLPGPELDAHVEDRPDLVLDEVAAQPVRRGSRAPSCRPAGPGLRTPPGW